MFRNNENISIKYVLPAVSLHSKHVTHFLSNKSILLSYKLLYLSVFYLCFYVDMCYIILVVQQCGKQ